jgi:solute carrier family 35, member E1
MQMKDIKYRRSNYYADAVDIESLIGQGNQSPSSESSSITNHSHSHSHSHHPDDHNSQSTDAEKQPRRWTSWLAIAFMVVLWYSFAVMTITTSKIIMNQVRLPYMLCCSQFTMAMILTRIYLSYTKKLMPIQSNFYYPVHQIAVSYTFGFIFTNLAFSLVNANFAETVKAGEPLSTVAFGLLLIREQHSLMTYLTLIPICSGVAISCFHDDSFHIQGFLYAVLSNFCFSTRAVIAKKLNLHHGGMMDEMSLFYHISRIGLMILIPLALWIEGGLVLERFVYNAHEGNTMILGLILVNGIGYTVYNVTSFFVLSRTNLITHAVLNVFRRVFIILFTASYFEISISWFNMLGIFIAVAGVLCFAVSKS